MRRSLCGKTVGFRLKTVGRQKHLAVGKSQVAIAEFWMLKEDPVRLQPSDRYSSIANPNRVPKSTLAFNFSPEGMQDEPGEGVYRRL